MVVVRPPRGSYVLPPGLSEESFDVDTPSGRANLLLILYHAITSINQEKADIARLFFIISGPVTYVYRPGGGICWEEVKELFVHPVNLKNIGFRNGGDGSLCLTRLLVQALATGLGQSGFSIMRDQFSMTVEELGSSKITIYNPTEIGYSAALWDVIDPGTSIYIGEPEDVKIVQDLIAFFPDKRTKRAAGFFNDAAAYADAGNYKAACRSLAGAAQVLGRIRLRSVIVQACSKEEVDFEVFSRFMEETQAARDTIDALWRYHAGGWEHNTRDVLVEPVSVTLKAGETGEFTALCRDLGIVCIATKSGSTATICLDKHELERRAGELGTAQVPGFSLFFKEVFVPGRPEKEAARFIRVRDADGTVRYYDLKKE